MRFSDDELNMIRQWFNAVEDMNCEYLVSEDYKLAKRIYDHLGMKVTKSIESGADDE